MKARVEKGKILSISVSIAFDLYQRDYLRLNRKSPKTEEAYSITCMWLTRRFGDKDMCTLTFNDVRNWQEWLFEWQSQNTVKNEISCLRMVLKFLQKRGYDVMDYEEIIVPKREKQTIRYLTEQEVRDFIYEVGRKVRGYSDKNRLRNVAIVELLYSSGIRNSELCALNRDSIKNRQFTVIGKSKESRIVFIDERTERAIDVYLSTRTDTNSAMFISSISGKRITSSTLRNIFTVICERSRFKNITPHTIRHSYGTKLLRKNVNLRYVADLMGHQSLDTTKLYTHYENPQLKEIYDLAHKVT